MHLRQFATAESYITMVARTELDKPITTKVHTAGAENHFYRIPPEDIAAVDRDGHDPEVIEKMYSTAESINAPIIRKLLDGEFPLTLDDRSNLATYIALTHSRGWRFRNQSNNALNLMARNVVGDTVTKVRVKRFLELVGLPTDAEKVANAQSQLSSATGRIELSKSQLIKDGVEIAVDKFLPLLLQRTWRLLKFEHPCLLTSGNPVGLWSPNDGNLGLGNALAIFFPLDRWTCLSLVDRGPEKVVPSGQTRARQINQAVACNAEKWIYHHPSDQPVIPDDIGPINDMILEVVSSDIDERGFQREILHLTSRSHSLINAADDEESPT